MENNPNHIICHNKIYSKILFRDVSFVVPLRIDSPERRQNIDTLINYTFKHFETNFTVLEADSERKYFPRIKTDRFKYTFIEDKDEIFHRTKWINRLISMSFTPIIAVWDADAIAPVEQIVESVNQLRYGEAIMSLPYDGRFYSCDIVSGTLFKKYYNLQILYRRIPVMRLMHGFHSVGGAYLVNKEKYLIAGGENENIYGWGPEDNERIYRMDLLNYPVYYSSGPMFHLCHPIMKNSRYTNTEIEKNNRNVLLKTCNGAIKLS